MVARRLQKELKYSFRKFDITYNPGN